MYIASSLEKSEKVKTGIQITRMLAFYLKKKTFKSQRCLVLKVTVLCGADL